MRHRALGGHIFERAELFNGIAVRVYGLVKVEVGNVPTLVIRRKRCPAHEPGARQGEIAQVEAAQAQKRFHERQQTRWCLRQIKRDAVMRLQDAGQEILYQHGSKKLGCTLQDVHHRRFSALPVGWAVLDAFFFVFAFERKHGLVRLRDVFEVHALANIVPDAPGRLVFTFVERAPFVQLDPTDRFDHKETQGINKVAVQDVVFAVELVQTGQGQLGTLLLLLDVTCRERTAACLCLIGAACIDVQHLAEDQLGVLGAFADVFAEFACRDEELADGGHRKRFKQRELCALACQV